jgi:hypothetical protein
MCARFLIARHGAATALYHAYNAPKLREVLQSPGSRSRSHVALSVNATFLSLIKELLKLGAHLKPQVN